MSFFLHSLTLSSSQYKMSPIKVALAGATGNLSVSVLEDLLNANFCVAVLSRIRGNSSKLAPHPKLTIMEVDFNCTQSLIAALQGPRSSSLASPH
jgi:uncharacterized protein YbjT (DUF2867 family)